jgi:multidrug resistance efflux pump
VLGALRTEELDLRKSEFEGKLRSARSEAARNDAAGRSSEARAALDQVRWFESQIALADRRLKACVLRSPVKGFVLSRRPRDLVGSMAEAGRTVLEVAEGGRWKVEIRVPQELVPAVTAGLEASFSTPAVPGESFEGKVLAVGASAEPGIQPPQFPVTFEVEDPGGGLRSGMRGQGHVALGTRLLGVRFLTGVWHWARWKFGV